MHFLILTQYFPPEVGAPQVRLSALGRELVRRGHRVTVVTAMPNYPTGKVFPSYRRLWFKREKMEGFEVIRVFLYAGTGRGVARLLNYFSFALTSLWGALRTQKPDIVFVESPPLFLGITGWLAARWHRARLILNVSDLWPDSVEALGITSRRTLAPIFALERFLYARAWLVCGTTRGIVRRLQENKRLPATKVLHLPNGADLELLSPRLKDQALLSKLAFGPELKVFLYAGTHGYAQGLDHVMETAATLKRPDVHFLFVGEGPDKARLQKFARERQLENVTFVSAQSLSQMPQYFSLATASLVPLIRADLFLDALPSKLIASLACGVAPIYCGDGEAADLLRLENCGLVVRPEDPVALQAAIERLSDDSVLCSTLARNARSLAEREFAWDRIIGCWLARVQTLLAEAH